LSEKAGAYDVQIALPGFDVKHVEVTATPSEIVVHAAAKQEKKT
jgi:HSP20 family molecular chaperone IbpA